MATVAELIKLRDEIEAALDEAIKRERDDVLADVRRKIRDYNLTNAELRAAYVCQ